MMRLFIILITFFQTKTGKERGGGGVHFTFDIKPKWKTDFSVSISGFLLLKKGSTRICEI